MFILRNVNPNKCFGSWRYFLVPSSLGRCRELYERVRTSVLVQHERDAVFIKVGLCLKWPNSYQVLTTATGQACFKPLLKVGRHRDGGVTCNKWLQLGNDAPFCKVSPNSYVGCVSDVSEDTWNRTVDRRGGNDNNWQEGRDDGDLKTLLWNKYCCITVFVFLP